MNEDGRRRRLAWLYHLKTHEIAPEHIPLDRLERQDDGPPVADLSLAGATFSGGLRFVDTNGAVIPVREPSGAPIVDDRYRLIIDEGSGRLVRSARLNQARSDDGVVSRAQVIDDGLRLIAALPDGSVRMWLLEDGSLVDAALPDADGDVFAVSADGQYLLAGQVVVNLSNHTPLFEIASAQTAMWDPITGFLWTGQADGIVFWALELSDRFQHLEIDGGVFAMQVIADGRLLVAGPNGVWIFPAP